MKMKNFLRKRGLAVFTALVLCTSLVAPSFAASFSQLQAAVSDGTASEGISVTTGDDGVRNITLNESVTYQKGEDGSEPITVQSGQIALDLNGQTVDSTGLGKVTFFVQGGSLTVQDTSDAKTGTITGGNGNGAVRLDNGQLTLTSGTISGNKSGDGVRVNGGTFTMNGGTISGNTASGVQVNGGTFTVNGGTISGNTASGVRVNGSTFTMNGGTISGNTAGGVFVENGKFTMKNGAISGNTAASSGGGVGVTGENSSFVMEGGVISGNTAQNGGGEGGGGGVWVKSSAKFEMSGGKITGNTVVDNNGGGNGGGVAIHQANFTMTGGEIYDNDAPRGTGVLINATEGQDTSYFKMSGGFVSGDGESCIYLEEGPNRNAYFTLKGDAVLNGKVYLGKGTQLITDNVTQPGGLHEYTGFTVIYEDGTTGKLDKSETESSETDGKGYEAPGSASLDVEYECTPNESAWVVNGTGHSHPCETCKKPLGAVVAHSYGDWSSAEGGHSRTCADCGAVETSGHSWSGWADSGENHTHSCTTCDATESVGHSWVEGTWVTSEDGRSRTRTDECSACLATKPVTEDIEVPDPEEPEPVPPETPVEPETPDEPPIVIDDPVVPLAPAPVDVPEDEVELEEIEDEAVPLAGLFTRADAIGYLWRQAGSPDAELSDFADVPEDHEWAVAIGWAQDMGIAVAGEDGNFSPDDLLLRSSDESQGEFQEFLNRYAAFAGIRLDDGELFIELDGEPDDIIMGEDAQVIFDDFFARLETALVRRRD